MERKKTRASFSIAFFFLKTKPLRKVGRWDNARGRCEKEMDSAK